VSASVLASTSISVEVLHTMVALSFPELPFCCYLIAPERNSSTAADHSIPDSEWGAGTIAPWAPAFQWDSENHQSIIQNRPKLTPPWPVAIMVAEVP
jgi:hypothetical protein